MMSKFTDKPPWKVEAKILVSDRNDFEAALRKSELQYMELILKNGDILPFAIDFRMDKESKNMVLNKLINTNLIKSFTQGRHQMKIWTANWPRNYRFPDSEDPDIKDFMYLVGDIDARIDSTMGPKILNEGAFEMNTDSEGNE